MIIQDIVIRPDGTTEVVETEVSDNYFDPPVKTIDDITALQLAVAELAELIVGG